MTNAYSSPVIIGDPLTYQDASMVEDQEKWAYNQFKSLEKKIPELVDTIYEYEAKPDFATHSIIDSIDSNNIDMIIMGTSGAANKLEEWLGSTTYDVITESTCPVLAIPKESPLEPPKKILFATDFQDIKYQKGLEVVCLLSEQFNAEIQILRVGKNPDHISEDETEGVTDLHNYFKGLPHTFHFSTIDDVAQGINEHISSNNIDLLALMPKKHSIYEKLFKERITKKIAHHTKVPLLAFYE